MNILENKRVLGLSVVFALAFGGLTYYGFDRLSAYDSAKKELEDINNRVMDFEQDEYPPTAATRKAMTAAAKKMDETLKALKADFAGYAAKCTGDGKNISSVEFQNQVRATIDELSHSAADKGCKLSGAAADLGMAQFKNAAATADDVPYRSFQLKAAKRVADIVVNSGAPELEKMYCASLPDPKVRKKKTHFPLSMEVVFKAKRSEVAEAGKAPVSVLPTVLNSLAADKDFFFKVTGLWVASSEPNLPAIDPYQGPAEDASQGDDITAEAEAKPETDARIIAQRKTGAPEETVNVHMNLQVLYFNPNTSKK